MRIHRLLVPAAALLLAAAPAAAQPGWSASPGEPTRAELQARMTRAADAARDPALADDARTHAANEAELLRVRLAEGDLQAGDQVAVEVEGETELTSTFTITPARELLLPGMAPLPMQGVLRTELQDHVRAHVARYVRDPVVRATSMVRVAVLGQVGTPGFYSLPAESLVSDAIMAAGGPLPTGRLAAARIERGGARIWSGQGMRDAVQYGLTLDQMSVRSGDQLIVPEQPPSRSATALRLATTLPAAVLAIIGITRLF